MMQTTTRDPAESCFSVNQKRTDLLLLWLPNLVEQMKPVMQNILLLRLMALAVGERTALLNMSRSIRSVRFMIYILYIKFIVCGRAERSILPYPGDRRDVIQSVSPSVHVHDDSKILLILMNFP